MGPAAPGLRLAWRTHGRGRRLLLLRPRPRSKGYLDAVARRIRREVGGFYAPTAVCTTAGRFCKHLSGSFGIKGIRVMKCILRLQLQPKRNPCYLRAQMYHLFSSDTFIRPFGLKLLSLSQVSRFSLSCCSPIWAFVVASCSSAEILQAQMGVEWGDGGRGERRKRRILINPFRSVLLSGYIQSCSDCRGQGLTR